MSYQILILPSAEKEINKLPLTVAKIIFEKIYQLAENPRPFGYKKLNNFKLPNLKAKSLYRVRAGDYRIVYSIHENTVTVTIAKVANRKEIYE